MAEREEGERGGTDGVGTGASREAERETEDPTAVFELLADETRFAIVRELAAERRTNWRWEGKTFAELRRAVGEPDAGNFSYHLDKLRGTLVAKDGDEYHLLNRGIELVGAVESGRYTGPGETRRGETTFGCPYPDCDRSLEGVYEDQYFRTRCPDHHVFNGTTLPPVVAAEHTLDELVEVATLEMRGDVRRVRSGVCSLCSGPVAAALPSDAPSFGSVVDFEVPDDAVFATFACEQCGFSFDVPPGVCVVDHPAVVAFYHDHGEDLRGRPYVHLPFTFLGHADVESTDPVRVRVDVELGGDALSLWLDGETNVVEYERE